jgi:hypothetical protein
MLDDQMNIVEMAIRDEIRNTLPDYNLKVLEQVGEITSRLRESFNLNLVNI